MKAATAVLVTLLIVSSVLGGATQNKWRKLYGVIRGISPLFTSSTTSQPATYEDIQELISGNTDFAFDLFKAISLPANEQLDGYTRIRFPSRKLEGNGVISPYSISSALAMMFAGAAGRTASQMKSSLHLTCPNVHGAFKEVNTRLLSNTDSENSYSLKVANSLWSQSDSTFKQSFVELVKENYRSEIKSVNFDQTSEILEETPDSHMLMLVNKVDFKGLWALPFESRTYQEHFRTLAGRKYPTKYIVLNEELDFFEDYDNEIRAVTLPYKNNKASMTIIAPGANKFQKTKELLNANYFSNILNKMRVKLLVLSMPRFEVESQFKLKETLQKLGVTDAFIGSEANFSEIDGTQDLAIGDVIHKTKIVMDQKGTEAAAPIADRKTFGGGSEGRRIEISDPFMFVIHDENGSILFVGQLTEPKEYEW